MASSFTWLSVLIKQNLKVIRPRTVVKCSWEDTFGMLLGKLEMQAEVTVEKVEICANDKFVDAHIVPIDALFTCFSCESKYFFKVFFNDIHAFFFFFFACHPGQNLYWGIRETCNQLGMALIKLYPCNNVVLGNQN